MKCNSKYFILIVCLFFIPSISFSQTSNDLRNKGDEFFSKKNWPEAIRYYERAHKINPETYFVNQIAECKQKIKQFESNGKFGQFRQKGDENFSSKSFSEAKRYYQEALKIKKDEYCSLQVLACNCWLSLEAKDLFMAENLYKQIEPKGRDLELELLLGREYFNKKNDKKAIEWLRKAADSGNKPAMKSLADVLIKGGYDDIGAIEWLNRAGEDTAPYYKAIGDRIWSSAGMQSSKYEEAIMYYKKSSLSQRELKDKCNELGDILTKMGKIDDANLWYTQGGKDIRVRNYETGMRHESHNKYAQAEEAYLKAATDGYPEAYKKLGDLYWNGYSEKAKNKNRYLLAVSYYEKSNMPNLNEMYFKAGMLYINDKSTVRDAEQLFLKITDQNLKNEETAQAYYLLGSLYNDEDKGIKRDHAKAETYLKASAELGNIDSQKKLADFYFRRKKFPAAFQWYSVIDKQNNPFGTYGMGTMMYNGLIKEGKNYQEEGLKLIIKAAEMGYKEAISMLESLSSKSTLAKESFERISNPKK